MAKTKAKKVKVEKVESSGIKVYELQEFILDDLRTLAENLFEARQTAKYHLGEIHPTVIEKIWVPFFKRAQNYMKEIKGHLSHFKKEIG